MISSPLFTRVEELIVTTGPIAQVGWASASSMVTVVRSSRSLNGPPLAVRISFDTSLVLPDFNACQSALCSESTGRSCPGLARAITISPPATRDSLFASANVFPTLRAARVGARPMEPVIALRTTSQVIAATSVDACGPSMT